MFDASGAVSYTHLIGSKHDIHAILQSLAGKGMAVIIISDDLPELLENCSRIMILKDGRIVDELTADRCV